MPIPKWLTDRKTEIDKQQEAWIKEHGEYHTFEQGETKILVDMTQPPKENINTYGKKQWIYTVEINSEKKKISVNPFLDRAIVQALSEEINPMTIVRVGKSTDTRYSIKEIS